MAARDVLKRRSGQRVIGQQGGLWNSLVRVFKMPCVRRSVANGAVRRSAGFPTCRIADLSSRQAFPQTAAPHLQ